MINSILNLPRYPSTRKSVSKFPEEAGVYLFFKDNTPIYIGKAVNLKNRVSSYFSTNLAPKTSRMVSESEEISIIKVTSELDSLLLEAKLIHDLAPLYNSTLKDDKHPLYIRITKEKYPRILTARKIEESEPNIAFYGPFPSSLAVRSVLRMLRRIFPYAEHKLGKRPCLYSHIGLCDPCPNFMEGLEGENKIKAQKIYKKHILSIKRILERKTDSLLKDLYRQMDKASKIESFEEAGVLRDQIKRLEYISQPILPTSGFLQNPNLLEDLRSEELDDLRRILQGNFSNLKTLNRIECFDVAHLAGSSPTASMVTFIEGEPEKSLYRHFRVRQIKGNNDILSLTEVIARRVKHFTKWGKPDLIIVDGGKGQVSAFTKVLKEHKIPVVGLAKRFETLFILKDKSFIEIRLKNSPALHLVQRIRNEAHRFARRYHHTLLKRSLLPNH